MAAPQIFDRNMKRLAYLDNAMSVGYNLEMNALWTASFSMPADDKKNSYCLPLNYVEIFDGDERIDLFRIIGEDLERSDGATRVYNCEHVLATLLNDVLFQYHQVGGALTRTPAVLNYILSKQTTRNWTLANCAFNRQFEYNFENTTLLSALFSVPNCFDRDYLWTWDTTRYPWTLSLVEPSSALKSEIRYRKNMTSIRKTTDASGIANRIYALGYGEGVNQLTIAGVNNGLPYVEDVNSIQSYGLSASILVDTRYEVAESLKAYAEQILKESAVPYISYEIAAIDLHRLTRDAFSRFRPGEIVRVLDAEDGISVRTLIVSVSKDDSSGDPGAVTVTIANKSRDIAGSISDLQSRALIGETYAQGATNQQIYNFSDNADATHAAKLKLYISESVVRINKMLLNVQFEPFRAFEKAVKGGGGQTTSSGGGATTSAGGGQTSSAGGGGTTSSGGGATSSSGGGGTTMSGGGATSSSGGGGTSYSGGGGTSYSGGGGTSSAVTLLNSNTVPDPSDDGGPGGANHNHAIERGTKLAVTDGTNITGYVTWVPSGKHTHEAHSHTIEAHTHQIPAHTHEIASHTHQIPAHTHQVSAHTHQIPAHTHQVSAHTHTVAAHTHTVADHTHTVANHTHTIQDHTHEIQFGIYEGSTASRATIKVDGAAIPAQSSYEDIDIVAYLLKDDSGKIVRGTWHTIEILPDTMSRIVGAVFCQTFCNSRGGGDY